MGKIRKAVIPVAGLGTRLLPATKSIPKEMLPVIDKPAIQYVVEEAVYAGLEHVLLVTGRNKAVLENHFDRAVELESSLLESGDVARLQAVESATNLADIHYVRQGNPLGLGHAVLMSETFVGEEPFAVLLGDDLIGSDETLLSEMKIASIALNANIVALMQMPAHELNKFGVAKISGNISENLVAIDGFVEKPNQGEEPSNYAIIGRYVLQPGVFNVLKSTTASSGGEIQLTDALNTMAKNHEISGPVIGLVFTGKRYDIGNRIDYLKSIVRMAIEREDTSSDFTSWLKQVVLTIN